MALVPNWLGSENGSGIITSVSVSASPSVGSPTIDTRNVGCLAANECN